MFVYIPVLGKLLAGLFIGACIGLTGIGGGILVLPALILLFGMSSTVAVGTANLYSFFPRIFATYHHWKQGTVAFRTSMYFLAGAVPSNAIIAYLVTWYAHSVRSNPQAWQNLQSGLQNLIAYIVIVSAVFIFWDIFARSRTHEASRQNKAQAWLSEKQAVRIAISMGLGAIVGGLVGAASIGGGILIIPILLIVFGLSPVRTVGSSVFIAMVLTLLSSIIYAGNSQLDAATAIIMGVGALVGVPVGTRLSKRLPDLWLRITIGGLVLISGALLLVGGGH